MCHPLHKNTRFVKIPRAFVSDQKEKVHNTSHANHGCNLTISLAVHVESVHGDASV